MKQLLNTLYVSTEGTWLRLEGETLVVMVEKEKRLQIPLHHLGGIVCIGRVNLSSTLMARCMKDGRTVVWLNENGRFLARLEGMVSGNILLRQAQFRAADDESMALALARAFVAGKIRNSRQVLLRSSRDSKSRPEAEKLKEAAARLAINLRNVGCGKTLDSIRGVEGDSARIYFSQFDSMIAPAAREGFAFVKRSRRPPRDKINALLSFLYSLLYNDCISALTSAGLDPQLGFLHAIRPGRSGLALDLQEEFRAVFADRLALTLINRNQLREKDFRAYPGGAVLLTTEGRKKLITAYQNQKRRQLSHPLFSQTISIGLIPLIQARVLARFLRGETEAYIPYLHK